MFTKVMLLAQRFISYAAIWLLSADGQDTKEQSDLCAFGISQGDAFCTQHPEKIIISELAVLQWQPLPDLNVVPTCRLVCILQLNMPL